MTLWITISRALVGVLGVVAVLVAAGNLVSGGGSMADPAMPGGLITGLLALGAAIWTTSAGTLRAVVVWLGVLGIVAVLAVLWLNVGDVQTRDLVVYVGIPTAVALLATMGIAVGRWRSGALGTPAGSR